VNPFENVAVQQLLFENEWVRGLKPNLMSLVVVSYNLDGALIKMPGNISPPSITAAKAPSHPSPKGGKE
jgi:hypothetical protein